jgi:glycosyltransferase involved in cell wall biosynthesis
MTDMICVDENYSTTRLLTHEKPTIENKPEDKFESVLFLPDGENRQGDGGLRTQGYFKISHSDKPLITVVTVVFNGEQFLEETIQSVINQTYDNVEYIIIDGGSTDGTLDILRKYEHAIDYWVSENDRGISDAFNKAVVCAYGEYINFQGDGDGFYHVGSVADIVDDVDCVQDMFISGQIKRISLTGEELYSSKHHKYFDKITLLFRMSLPHQGLFTHRDYFKKFDLFDVDNKFCMDYEHLLRSYHNFPRVLMKNMVVARWRDDGLGNGRILDVLKEYDKIKRKNNIASDMVLSSINCWILFKYYVKEVVRNV